MGPDDDPELTRAKERAFTTLGEVGRGLETESFAEMAAAAQRLLAQFREQPAGEALAGFGAMALDASLWLLAGRREGDALTLCTTLVDRLAEGSAAERSVAAGARFLQAQAYGRLGRPAEARASLEALCGMGEPALAALDRLSGRLVAAGADPAWHAQLAAASVTVVWRLGRVAEARAIAREAAAAFARLGQPQLEALLLSLEREIGEDETAE